MKRTSANFSISSKVIPITNQHADSQPCIKPGWPRSLSEWPRSLKCVSAYMFQTIENEHINYESS